MTENKTASKSTFEVKYSDENGDYTSSDFVRPVPFLSPEDGGGLTQIIDFQEQLLKIAVFEVAVIGALICNPQVMGIIRKMALILPVVGRTKKGIDLDKLLAAGDYLQIGRIFFSEGYDGENAIPDDFSPSSIARINQMNFTGKLGEYSNQRIEQRMKEQTEEDPKPIAIAPEIPKKVEPPKSIVEIPQPVAMLK
jgi:hypothetical protein